MKFFDAFIDELEKIAKARDPHTAAAGEREKRAMLPLYAAAVSGDSKKKKKNWIEKMTTW